MSTLQRLGSGNYRVLGEDGRKIGFILRQQRPTAKIGYMDFYAFAGTQPHVLGWDTPLGVSYTLREAVAHVERWVERNGGKE